jgi:hypothetical protein
MDGKHTEDQDVSGLKLGTQPASSVFGAQGNRIFRECPIPPFLIRSIQMGCLSVGTVAIYILLPIAVLDIFYAMGVFQNHQSS